MGLVRTSMGVLAKSSPSIIWDHQWGRRARDTGHRNGNGNGSVPPAASDAVAASAPNRRQGGQSQDQALYKCGCGYGFEALVSTTVDCPRCGTTQAW
jgi:hypothetical protein